ncbi:unnamed protein product [Lupinus luteus]|uniref:Protein Jade-1 n=1 Tax=Lupinus luteus TaxID=3873 RepID=A0AAV1Y4E1_LUPLU
MDSSSFNHLPPLKRLRFIHQQQQQQQHRASSNSTLPAKKRKESRDSTFFHNPPTPFPTTLYSLPAKKRVCAFHPCDTVSLPFDLNIEYTPSPKKPINKIQSFTNPSPQKEKLVLDGDNEIDEDDGILCCVCQSTDGDPEDPIVFCDGCDLMVHASCYGNPLSKGIPEGDWFCERCRFDEKTGSSFSCCLCPIKEGAMKQTTDNRWAHIVCAVFVPEVFFSDPEGREGIDCSKVPTKRWSEKCYVCDTCDGCALVCSELKCGLGFHVTCGVREDLCIEYKEGKKGGTIVAGFCKSHSQIWEKQQLSGKYKIVAIEDKK